MALQRTLLGFLLFALVAAQAMGLVHRVVHVGHADAVSAAPARVTAVGDAQDWVARLFGSHDESGCRLFDQLGHDGALPALPHVALPLLLPSFVLQWFQGEVLARWAALFDARGPPPVR